MFCRLAALALVLLCLENISRKDAQTNTDDRKEKTNRTRHEAPSSAFYKHCTKQKTTPPTGMSDMKWNETEQNGWEGKKETHTHTHTVVSAIRLLSISEYIIRCHKCSAWLATTLQPIYHWYWKPVAYTIIQSIPLLNLSLSLSISRFLRLHFLHFFHCMILCV